MMRTRSTPLLLAALAAPLLAAGAPPSDTAADYAWSVPVRTSGRNAVVQLRLPPAVYLHARHADLRDLRLFDGTGQVVPMSAVDTSAPARATRRTVPARVFALPAAATDAAGPGEVSIRTAPDGTVTAVAARARGGQRPGPAIGGLILDLGTDGQARLIDALRFSPPAGTTNYSAQVTVEASDDLHRWEPVAYATLSWLANGNHDTLSNDRIGFDARPLRYARLTWQDGQPLQFASVSGESPGVAAATRPLDTIVLAPHAGHAPGDLVYDAGPALPVDRMALQFGAGNAVLPVLIGSYRELPALQGAGASRWEFDPRLQSTFFQITQNGRTRASGPVTLDGATAAQWVLRPQQPFGGQPRLQLWWTPATLVFLASGPGPYTLGFGRAQAEPAWRPLAQVAPGFAPTELPTLEQATVGEPEAHTVASADPSAAVQAGRAARTRIALLWGALALGVAVLAYMAWKLLGQMKADEGG